MAHDLDEMVSVATMSEEKAQQTMINVARLGDKLYMEKNKKLLDAQAKVDKAKQNFLKGGKKAMSKRPKSGSLNQTWTE